MEPIEEVHLKLMIPEKFEMVVKKIRKEIETISIEDSSYYNMVQPLTLEINRFVILKISISVNANLPILSKELYSEELHNLFKMTYPQYDFVQIKVISIKINRPDYFSEFLNEFTI